MFKSIFNYIKFVVFVNSETHFNKTWAAAGADHVIDHVCVCPLPVSHTDSQQSLFQFSCGRDSGWI